MSEGTSQWVSVVEAARVSGVSERTAWRWVRDGIVESRHEKRGQQSTRLVNRDSLPEEPCQRTSEAVATRPDMAEAGSASQGLNPSSHDLSPGAAGQCSDLNIRADLAEQEASLLRRERDRLVMDLERAHALIDVRTEELRRRDVAEGELRQLLALSQTALRAALERPALPPAPDPQPAPRRARWAFWRR